MSLASLAGNFFTSKKALNAGEDAANLYVRGLCWARENETGGEIPKTALAILSAKRDRAKHAQACVDATLWHDEGDHWRIHDYEVWYSNDAEAKAERQRKLAAARARTYRQNHKPPAERPPSPPTNGASRVTERDGASDVTRDGSVTDALLARPGTRAFGECEGECLPPNPPQAGGDGAKAPSPEPEPEPQTGNPQTVEPLRADAPRPDPLTAIRSLREGLRHG